MPIVAVAVAVIADVSAVSGAIAGTLGVFEAVGAIGATVGAIGAVTGNKTLSIAGTVLGGIGGIGSLANAAGIIGDPTVGSFFGADTAASTADTAATATTDSFSGLGSPTGAVDSASAAADPAAAASSASGDIINNLGQTTGTGIGLANSDLGVPDLNAALGTSANSASALGDTSALSSTAADATTAGTAAATGTGVADAATSAGNVLPPVVGSGVGDSAAVAAGNTVTGAPAAASDNGLLGNIFGKIGSFVSNDKTGMVKYGLIQAAGSLVGGMFDPLKPAQVAALDAQAAANRAATQLSLTQQANMAQPLPVATRTAQPQPAVTGVPVGMINQPVATGVTGAPGT
jgi:hypothetical protein